MLANMRSWVKGFLVPPCSHLVYDYVGFRLLYLHNQFILYCFVKVGKLVEIKAFSLSGLLFCVSLYM